MIEMGVRICPRRSRSSGPLSEAALAAYPATLDSRSPRLAWSVWYAGIRSGT